MNVKISDYITDSKCTAGELNRVCELLNDGDTLSLGGVKLDITEKDIFKKHYLYQTTIAAKNRLCSRLYLKRI